MQHLGLSDDEKPALIALLKHAIADRSISTIAARRDAGSNPREARIAPGPRARAAAESLCTTASDRCQKMAGKTISEARLMKLPQPRPGEQRYAVAIRDGSDLWLTLWVQCSPDGQIFIMLPRRDLDWDVHASYHINGRMHMKTLLRKRGYRDTRVIAPKGQALTAAFKGFQRFVNLLGHGKACGAVCDPRVFDGVVCVEPSILAPSHTSVAVDLLEPGYAPKPDLTISDRRFREVLVHPS
jgi:hypothetical protein